MASPLHSQDEIAAFLGDGEARLIAASFRDPAREREVFILPDGKARELRDFTKANLRCVFPDCVAPDLTTVARAFKRDGFSHLPGAGKHSPESINHRQGIAVLARWLRSMLGHDSVKVEAASDSSRTRVADVMATLADGERVAFEIQYAALSVEAWRARHESYAAQGITDVWLWGHTRVRKSRAEWFGGEPDCRLDDVQFEARAAGLPVFFFNPELERIALAAPWFEHSIEAALKREAVLRVEPLSAFRLDATGLHSSSTRALASLFERLRQQAESRKPNLSTLSRPAEVAKKPISIAPRVRVRRPADWFLNSSTGREANAAVSQLRRSELKCSVCGGKLDPALAGLGHHVGPCDWATRR